MIPHIDPVRTLPGPNGLKKRVSHREDPALPLINGLLTPLIERQNQTRRVNSHTDLIVLEISFKLLRDPIYLL